MSLIHRPTHLARVRSLLSSNRVVAVLGARQVGKTTLARELVRSAGGETEWFDLEDPRDLARLSDPMLALEKRKGLVVLDEIQRRPELFPALRVLADRARGARFLVLGSASGELLRQSSESLAGRIAYHELPPLRVSEVGTAHLDRLWLRGGFPRAYSAKTLAASVEWRQQFIRTFLERDIPSLGSGVRAPTLERFWSMLAHWHGQTMNWSELGRAMGVTDHTVRSYLDLLSATFMVRLLPPWHENLSKRQVKSPKAYVRDSGLLHTLLDIRDLRQLERHPKVGASWEGFCIDDLPGARRAAPGALLLGDALRRRARSPLREGAPPARLRGEAHDRAAADPLDGLGLHRPEAGFSSPSSTRASTPTSSAGRSARSLFTPSRRPSAHLENS